MNQWSPALMKLTFQRAGLHVRSPGPNDSGQAHWSLPCFVLLFTCAPWVYWVGRGIPMCLPFCSFSKVSARLSPPPPDTPGRSFWRHRHLSRAWTTRMPTLFYSRHGSGPVSNLLPRHSPGIRLVSYDVAPSLWEVEPRGLRVCLSLRLRLEWGQRRGVYPHPWSPFLLLLQHLPYLLPLPECFLFLRPPRGTFLRPSAPGVISSSLSLGHNLIRQQENLVY